MTINFVEKGYYLAAHRKKSGPRATDSTALLKIKMFLTEYKYVIRHVTVHNSKTIF
jgi:hypothetical protein